MMNVINKNFIQNKNVHSDAKQFNKNLPNFQIVRRKQFYEDDKESKSGNEQFSQLPTNLTGRILNYPRYVSSLVQRSTVQTSAVNEENFTKNSTCIKTPITINLNRNNFNSESVFLNSTTSNRVLTSYESLKQKFSLDSKSTTESKNFFSSDSCNSTSHRTSNYIKNYSSRKSARVLNNGFSSDSSNFFATPNKCSVSSTSRTPKSATSNDSDGRNHTIVAITEGRGHARGEVGIAAMDVKRPILILCQISDTQTYRNTLQKINILNPIKILLPETFCDSFNTNKLYQMLSDEFPRINLLKVQRKFFNEIQGLQHIQNLCLPEYSSIQLVVQKKIYALAAATVIIKYIEFEEHIVFSSKSLRIDYQGGDNITFIDLNTARKLELVISQNIINMNTENSLFGILNKCCTFGGQRRLRTLILQPSTEEIVINERLNCVQELIKNSELLSSLQSILRKFEDVEQLLWLCAQISYLKDSMKAAELQINYALLLKSSLEMIPVLQNAISNTKSNFFASFHKSLNDVHYSKMLVKLHEMLNDDSHLSKNFDMCQFQRCFAIRTGINEFLDIARLAYSELVQDFNEIVEDLIKEHHLPLVIQTLKSKGPVIQMRLTKNNKNFNVKDLPPIFIQVQKSQSVITMTTKELLFLKERMNHFIQEIVVLSSGIIFEMLQEIREYIGSLYKLCENIAELDLIVSFAQISKNIHFVRPIFSNDCTDVKVSVHPILDRISFSSSVANDIFTSVNQNMCIITGPNMGGKSVYIRQIALLQIMAQIGCYIPAEFAQFRITDRIFSRIGFNDDIECNASSFIVEIKEMQHILKSVTSHSLVIIDELCRGTSTEEGTAIAWAICEELLSSTAFIYLTTHFLFLTKLENLYCNAANFHFEALELNSDSEKLSHIVYTHRLVPGVLKMDHYGLKLAKNTAMPDSILESSKEIADKLTSFWKVYSGTNKNVSNDKKIDNIILKLLEMRDNSTLTLNVINEIMNYVIESNLVPLQNNQNNNSIMNAECEIMDTSHCNEHSKENFNPPADYQSHSLNELNLENNTTAEIYESSINSEKTNHVYSKDKVISGT